MSGTVALRGYEITPSGGFVLRKPGAATRVGEHRRRFTKTPTLDLGVSVYDAGYSAGDQTFVIDIPVENVTTVQRAVELVQLYAEVVVHCALGAYRGFATEAKDTGETVQVTVEIVEQL